MATSAHTNAVVRGPFCRLQVRKAVGLGRMALDPLAVISTLLGRRKELLSLKLHELQERLPQELLATRLEQVRVVCWVLLCCVGCLWSAVDVGVLM
jgi:hypothetical protein